jgi:hypothetical protein
MHNSLITIPLLFLKQDEGFGQQSEALTIMEDLEKVNHELDTLTDNYETLHKEYNESIQVLRYDTGSPSSQTGQNENSRQLFFLFFTD